MKITPITRKKGEWWKKQKELKPFLSAVTAMEGMGEMLEGMLCRLEESGLFPLTPNYNLSYAKWNAKCRRVLQRYPDEFLSAKDKVVAFSDQLSALSRYIGVADPFYNVACEMRRRGKEEER